MINPYGSKLQNRSQLIQPDLDLDDAHDISQLTTVPHLTSPHNQHITYFISPRNQPHDIKTDHITTTANHHHGSAEGCCAQKPRFGHGTAWSPCAHDRHILSLAYSLFPFETAASGLPALLVCIFYVRVLWR